MEAVTACNIALALVALLFDAMASGQEGAQVKIRGSARSSASLAKVVYIENHSTLDGVRSTQRQRGFLHAHSMHIWTRQNFVDGWQLTHIASALLKSSNAEAGPRQNGHPSPPHPQ